MASLLKQAKMEAKCYLNKLAWAKWEGKGTKDIKALTAIGRDEIAIAQIKNGGRKYLSHTNFLNPKTYYKKGKKK